MIKMKIFFAILEYVCKFCLIFALLLRYFVGFFWYIYLLFIYLFLFFSYLKKEIKLQMKLWCIFKTIFFLSLVK